MGFEVAKETGETKRANQAADRLVALVAALLHTPPSGRGALTKDGKHAHDQAMCLFRQVSDETLVQALRRLYREGERDARKRAAMLARTMRSRLH